MILSPHNLQETIHYDPETGFLRWKERPLGLFKEGHRQNNACASWNSKFAGRRCLTTPSNGYLVGRVFGKTLKAHRVGWAIHFGKWPDQEIDHINRVKTDNRIANLRDTGRSEQNLNKRISKTNKTGVRGVHRHRDGGFVAKHRGKYLGIFPSIAEAEMAVLEETWRRKHGPDFAFIPVIRARVAVLMGEIDF